MCKALHELHRGLNDRVISMHKVLIQELNDTIYADIFLNRATSVAPFEFGVY